ncbi:ABC transporter substrate-binding protein [Alphaproteobacteria bacterium]|nr:ABC transporter substrate-binding protein [Alphaproteobacteria bacterium]
MFLVQKIGEAAQSLRRATALLTMSFVLAITMVTSAKSAEINVRLGEDFTTLDPAFWQSGADFTMINVLFPKLIEFKSGSNWEWELQAAESIEQVDELTIKFTLKPGLMWTNGYGEVTAEDVKYSYERYVDPELKSPIIGDWLPLKEVEVVDKYSGIIHLKEAFAPIWWSTLPYTSGAIVSKEATEAAGGKFTTDPGATAGAYKIETWVPREKTVLVPHDGWNGPKAGFDRITILPIQETKSAEIAFEAEEIDITEIAISSVPNVKSSPPAGGVLDIRPTADYSFLSINNANPKMGDVRVRQAIVKAVDVDTILQGAYFGVPEISSGLVAPGLIGYTGKAATPRDVEGARALLAEAGVSDLSLEIDVLNTAENVTAAQIIQANLAEIGISLQINQLDSGAYWNVASEKKEALELVLTSYTSPPDPSWSTQWFLSEQKGIWNWAWLESEEFDNLHYAALKEKDLDKRASMYYRMQEIMDESGGFVWIMHPPSVILYRDTIVPGLYPNGGLKLSGFQPAN